VIDLKNPFLMRESLYACDGTLIVRQGEIITQNILEKISERGRCRRKDRFALKNSELLHDIAEVMNEENYGVFFEREASRHDVLEVVKDIPLTKDICKELELFKIMDRYTYRHILITAAMATRMALDLSQDPQKVLLAASSALMHDFGKSRIPLEILQSSKKLNYEEFVYILEHPWIGFLLLTFYTGSSDTLPCQMALNHHEKIDGTGYPQGIREQNPTVQLVTICDMFDALISPRTYRADQFNIRGALDYLCEEAERGHLNVDDVKLLISYNRQSKTPPSELIYSEDHFGYRPSEERNNYSGHQDYREPDLDEDNSGTAV
jgi:HD-GYP domain-containing protein (c-di-GMP phosphodiesterase class II)